MSAIKQNLFSTVSPVKNEIESHPAWLGCISGLKAEKMLRNRNQPYLYVLRAGECENDYYITFVAEEESGKLFVKHQPFTLTVSRDTWFYENAAVGGPYTNSTTINDVLHLIMHCGKDQCMPLINFQK